MKRRRLAYLLAVVPFALWAVEGCSGSDSNGGDDMSGTDSGSGGNNTDDSGGGNNGNGIDGSTGSSKDSGGGNTDGGGGDGGIVVTTPGTQIKAVTDAVLVGVTSDGYALYLNNTDVDGGGADAAGKSSLEIVPIAGGAATVLFSAVDISQTGTDDLMIVGKTVAIWRNIDNTGTGDLYVWTATNGKANLIATKSFDRFYDASEDGTHVAYSSNVSATTMTLSTLKSDGTGAAVNFTTTARSDDMSCGGALTFKKAVAFAQYCTKANATTGTLASIDTGPAAVAGQPKSISTTANASQFVVVDDSATLVFWTKGATNQGVISKFDGSGTDVNEETNIGESILNADGSKLIYMDTDGGVLKNANTTGNPPASFQLFKPLAGFLDFTTDYSQLVVSASGYDQTTNPNVQRIDLKIASAIDAGTPTPLTDAGDVVGFNSTNAYYFYLADLPATGSIPSGTLKAHPIAGGADKTIATGAIFPSLVPTTSKVVFISNIQSTMPVIATDLSVGDGAGAGAASVLVKGADPSFFVSGGKVVYFSAGKGIYAVAVP